MTLYEMLDVTLYYQKVRIYLTNAYDQNMCIFKGTVDDARSSDLVWDRLMHKVHRYECTKKDLIIFIENEYYDYRFEEKEFVSRNWTEDNRPWKYSIEIKREVQ